MARYQHRDRFYRKADQLGLPSRAAFKLQELLKRYKLVGKGGRVVDLGCAPGGWLAILTNQVGTTGQVVGIDLAVCRTAADNLITLTGDITDLEVQRRVSEALGSAADLVTSDLAPKLSGIAERDQAGLRRLLEAALDLAQSVLKPGGAMVAKLFMGPGFEEMRELLARHFVRVETVRTRATRPGSSELYVVAQGFRPSPQRPASGG